MSARPSPFPPVPRRDATNLERLLWWAETIGGSLDGRANDEYFEVRTSDFHNLRHAARAVREEQKGE